MIRWIAEKFPVKIVLFEYYGWGEKFYNWDECRHP
jgi:hypothetical protein